LANWHVQKVEQAEPSALSQSLTASWLSAGQRRLPSSAPSLPAEASTTLLASATKQEPARPALSAPPASGSLADSEGLDAASLSTEAPMPELDPTWLVDEQAMAAEPMSLAVRNVHTARRLMREALRVCDADPASSLSLGVGDHVELELRENSELGDVVFIQQEGGAGIHSARLLVAGRSYKLLFSESSWQHFRLPHATRAGSMRLEVLSLYQPALGAARLAELQLKAPEGPRSSASEGATVGDERWASVW
ncbi:MAG: hypothetical protein RBU37_22130, partial [Myxococcota bacterium]|jgi:hypothetical protein|nr:hypothetical protein [Myxococcota bacterium]